MDLDFHHLCFPGDYATDALFEAFEKGFDSGWATTTEGGVEKCTFTDISSEKHRDEVETETAIEQLSTQKNGWIVIFDRDSEVDFKFKILSDWSEYGLPNLGGVMLTWHRVHSYDDPEQTTTVLFDAASLVYDALKPPFAFSWLARDADRETIVTPVDIETERIPDAYWMMLLSKPICERVGRDRIHSASVWETESLADGGIGIVATADPYQYTEADKMRLKTALGMDG